jgi:formylglycine-generating enzyme required for sulfatase activity
VAEAIWQGGLDGLWDITQGRGRKPFYEITKVTAIVDTGNYPVTGISYLEARAFVRWLQLRYPDPGWTWCIPSEDMWELAAR